MHVNSAAPAELAPATENPGIHVALLGECDPLQWEAALLMGEAKHDELRELAKTSHGHGSESSYRLGIGLARLDGARDRFDDLALEFAVNLDADRPIWLDQSGGMLQKEIVEDQVQVESLCFEKIIETTIKLESLWPVSLNLSGVQVADEAGLELLNESLGSRIQRDLVTRIIAGPFIEQLVTDLIANKTVFPSQKWVFAFHYLRLVGDAASFAAIARNFEEKGGTAPAYRDLVGNARVVPEVVDDASGRFMAGAKMSDVNVDFAQRILRSPQLASASSKVVVVDFSKTRDGALPDVISLAAFAKVIEGKGYEVNFINVNEVLAMVLLCGGVNPVAIASAVEKNPQM